MTDQIRRKAKMLLIELESLKQCAGSNSIGTFALLEEVLKDADSLAKQAVAAAPAMPGTLEERIAKARQLSAQALANSKKASAKSALSMARSQKLVSFAA